MKPCCDILILGRNSSIFGCPLPKCGHFSEKNLSKSQSRLHYLMKKKSFHRNSLLGYRSATDLNRRDFYGSGSKWGQSRISLSKWAKNNKFQRVLANFSSDTRNHSNSIESHVNENSFEKIYIQSVLNIKPLLVEGGPELFEKDGEEKQHKAARNNGTDANANQSAKHVSDVEKDAWQLLREAVVNYCGNPVGTVAATDPSGKQPLNYDQVFVRDFVPSALAFLLNGEGEIVKNFLLHTLQLQVILLKSAIKGATV